MPDFAGKGVSEAFILVMSAAISQRIRAGVYKRSEADYYKDSLEALFETIFK